MTNFFFFTEAEQLNKFDTSVGDYQLEGDLKEGQCFLRVGKVQQQDEGDWRCVVQVVGQEEEFLGPLLHLHVTDLPYSSNHSHGKSVAFPLLQVLLYQKRQQVLAPKYITF